MAANILAIARAAVTRWNGRTVGGMDLPTVMVAISGAESSWRLDAAGDPSSSTYACNARGSWGPWQIYMVVHHAMLVQFTGSQSPCIWATWLQDPGNAARAADKLISNRSSAYHLPLSALRPWTQWWSADGDPTNDAGDGNGVYRQYMAQAAAAVSEVRQSPPPPTTPPTSPPPPPQLPATLLQPLTNLGLRTDTTLVPALVAIATLGVWWGMSTMQQRGSLR